MIYYLTYNDTPSGIYSSQVIDVVKFLNTELNANVKLISFISLRGYFKNRKKIKNELTQSIVLPMFPGVHQWRKNVFLLYLLSMIMKPDAIIARSVLATQLALKIKKLRKTSKVIYDGRGAISSEWKEYGVITHPKMLKEIHQLEKQAVILSDFRIAVSEQLVKFWKTEFSYNLQKHVIIPCTVNKVFEELHISDESIKKSRELLGLKKEDLVFMYSGSIAGWQSFELLSNFLDHILAASPSYKVVFLSDFNDCILALKNKFPGQIINKKLRPNEVPNYLISGDYGILIREETITNKVASPVKFAEYLTCGLKVVISNNLGDYSSFITENPLLAVDPGYKFQIIPINEKKKIREESIAKFTKRQYRSFYKSVVNN